MRSQHPVTICEAFASANHGVIPRQVALDNGVDDPTIHRLLKSGRWTRLLASAYVVSGVAVTWRTRLAAVVANLEKGFAFSHRTATALMGLEGMTEGPIDIVTCRTPRLPKVNVHRVRPPLPQPIYVAGFPVTSAHRTVLDLFSVLRPKAAALALEDALRKKLTTIERLSNEYTQTCSRGRNGCRAFRAELLRRDHRDGTLQSRMEAKLRHVLRTVPGPKAQPQFPVETPQNRYRIDFAYPDIKLGIEAQSIKWHMGEAKFYYDLRRDRHLKACGWILLYYMWDDLLRPAIVRAEITDLRRSMERLLF